MPLSPAEVHNVAFKKPPIGKRGYDEEEVDAFLDIVEVELARLIEENNDLRARGGGGAPAEAGPDNSAELASAHEENQRLQGRIGELEQTINQGNDGAQQQVVALQQQLAQLESQLAENRGQLEQAQQALAEAQSAAAANLSKNVDPSASPEAHHQQAVQILTMAQQTADNHLAQSKAEAERLVTEAQSQAESTVAAANEHHERKVAEAESRAKQLDDDSTSRARQTVQDAEQRAATITAQFEQRKSATGRWPTRSRAESLVLLTGTSTASTR
jgi:DivIVA domain-containing protein